MLLNIVLVNKNSIKIKAVAINNKGKKKKK
jgi:hypothetical protein